jgi:hypothetical protein
MQTMARKNEWPLDRMCLTIDVTKKTKEDYGHPPREGAYLHGLHLEGESLRNACGTALGTSWSLSCNIYCCDFISSSSLQMT